MVTVDAEGAAEAGGTEGLDDMGVVSSLFAAETMWASASLGGTTAVPLAPSATWGGGTLGVVGTIGGGGAVDTADAEGAGGAGAGEGADDMDAGFSSLGAEPPGAESASPGVG